MLELTLVERELGKTESVWKEAADRHYASAKRAIDQLVASQGDFETEGELTFEDGMVSCSALQIGMLALMQQDEKERKHYTDAMLQILNSHDLSDSVACSRCPPSWRNHALLGGSI